MNPQLQNLLHHVVEDEHAEDRLTTQDEVVPAGDVAQQLDRSDLVGGNRSTCRWEFNHQTERQSLVTISRGGRGGGELQVRGRFLT